MNKMNENKSKEIIKNKDKELNKKNEKLDTYEIKRNRRRDKNNRKISRKSNRRVRSKSRLDEKIKKTETLEIKDSEKFKKNKNTNIKKKTNKNLNKINLKDFEKDENVKKIIKPKYNLIINFFNEINNYMYLILLFAFLIIIFGDQKVIPYIMAILMIISIIVKIIIDYKSFNNTVYILYGDKIVQKNFFLNKEKQLHYENLKDVKYGNYNNAFANILFNVNDIVFISKKRNIFKKEDIKIPNQPNGKEYRSEIVQTIDTKYVKQILEKQKKKKN